MGLWLIVHSSLILFQEYLLPQWTEYIFFLVDGFKSGGIEGEIWIFVNEDVVKAASESDNVWWNSINGIVTVPLKQNDLVKAYSYYNNSLYVDIYNPVTFIGFQLA